MKIYLQLANIVVLLSLLSGCSNNGKLKGVLINPELTGGITSTKRPYTQTSDGRDQVLTTTKNNNSGKTPLNIENISVEREQSNYRVTVSVDEKTLKFEGAAPTAANTTSKLSRVDSENTSDSLTLSCSDTKCSSALVGNLNTAMGEATVTLRSSTTAQARILYLSKHDAFEISSSFGPLFSAVPGFISQFQQSTPVSATSYEVALGKAAAKIDLAWGEYHFCLETDVTTTDTGPSPLTSVKITCGQDLLPKIKIDLVGNNQKGKLGFRFNIEDRSTFILFVDLNGKKISNPLLPINPETLINPIGLGQRVFPENLKNPRTFNIIKQIYSDIPRESVTVAPEQSHGFEIIKKWLLKWQGTELDAGSCGGDSGKIKVQGIMRNFLKKAPTYFEKVKENFYNSDVPTTFMFTTLIESPKFYNKFNEIEVSKSQCVGPWQLLDKVAQEWGLAVFPLVDGKADSRDERGDFEKASSAAVLQYDRLLGYFAEADYKLALASYNGGAKNVLDSILNAVDLKEYEDYFSKIPNRKKDEDKPINYSSKPENYKERIEKNRSEIDNTRIKLSSISARWAEKIPNYWFLHEFHMMPCETRDYVPKLVSAMIVGEDPKAFGF